MPLSQGQRSGSGSKVGVKVKGHGQGHVSRSWVKGQGQTSILDIRGSALPSAARVKRVIRNMNGCLDTFSGTIPEWPVTSTGIAAR